MSECIRNDEKTSPSITTAASTNTVITIACAAVLPLTTADATISSENARNPAFDAPLQKCWMFGSQIFYSSFRVDHTNSRIDGFTKCCCSSFHRLELSNGQDQKQRGDEAKQRELRGHHVANTIKMRLIKYSLQNLTIVGYW